MVVGSVLFAYTAGSAISWWTLGASGMYTGFFLVVGLTLVAFLSLPRRRWPLVAAAIVVGELIAGTIAGDAVGPLTLALFGLINATEGMVGAALVSAALHRRPGIDSLPDLGRRRDLVLFALTACAAGPAIGAIGGAVVSSWQLDAPIVDAAFQWWLGHALGIILISPLFFVWTATRGPRSWRRPAAVATALGTGIGAAIALTASNMPVLFFVLAGLVVAGACFDVRTIALSCATIAIAVGVSLALEPDGLIIGLSASTWVTLTKLELLLFALTGYLVAAETNERMLATADAAQRLDTLGELQQLLLPPLEMEGGGYRVRGAYYPVQRDIGIGGDWYLVRTALDGRLVFAVGDIVGHDARAARSMAAVRSGLVLEAAVSPDAGSILRKLDSFSDIEPTIRYSTAWVGVFDPVSRTLDYACAGHLPPLLTDGTSIRRLDDANSALVGIPQGRRVSTTTHVPPNSSIVLYTDGVVERRSAGIDPGIVMLEQAVLKLGPRPTMLLEHMLADSPREDDSVIAAIDFDRSHDRGDGDSRLRHPASMNRAVRKKPEPQSNGLRVI